MLVLKQTDYNAAYFGDTVESNGLRHIAGYTDYLKLVKEKNYYIRAEGNLKSMRGKILELGCGVGIYAKIARARGLDWTAVDSSDWCKAHEESPIIKSDALTYLKTLRDDSYDFIFSSEFLVCIDESNIDELITEMNRVGKQQIHTVNESGEEDYYNIKNLDWWKARPFKKGTVLTGREHNLSNKRTI